MNIDKLIITQIDSIEAFDNVGNLEFILDEVTDCTISNAQDKEDITGRGGRKIASLKKNKTATISGTNGYLVGGALASMSGSVVSSGSKTIKETDIITYNTSTLTTYTALGTLGSEIKYIYKVNGNGSLGKKFTQTTATPATGEFKYDANTKSLTFFTGDLTKGDQICAFYDRTVEDAGWITNESDKYSKTLKLVVNATATDNCDNEYHVQIIAPRCDFDGNFDLTMGNTPSTQSFSGEFLAGGCGQTNEFYTLIVF